jgi:RND family efflux transporter MFP subunit
MDIKRFLSKPINAGAMALTILGVSWLVSPAFHGSSSHASADPQDKGSVSVSDEGKRVVDIQTEAVRLDAFDGTVNATGQVSFPLDQTVHISPRLQGRIRTVLVQVGDMVSKGQTLAVMDSVDAASAQANAMQAENKLRLAKSNLEREKRLYRLGTSDVAQAEANMDQAHARTEFTKDALAKIREQARIGGFTQKPFSDAQNDLVGARADLASAQSDLAAAERERVRTAKLVEIGVAAKRDLEAAEDVSEKARVAVEADKEKVKQFRQSADREQKAYDSNLYADQQVRSAESDYRQAVLQEQAAGRALQLAKSAILRDLQQAQSDYQSAVFDAQNARRVLDLLGRPGSDGCIRITSPINGILVERNVNPGQTVDQSQMTPWQMFTISNNKSVWIATDVYEKDVANVRSGQVAGISTSSLPGFETTGKVDFIAPMIDPKTHAVKVRIRIPNPKGLLKDGMFVEVAIRTGRGRPAPVIPLSAVQHTDKSDYVYVEQHGKYTQKPVRVGAQHGDYCTVDKGLEPGECVVTKGALFLGDQAGNG